MFISLLLAAAQPAEPAPPASECSYDLEAMLALDRNAFDQDLNGGWRVLAKEVGCELATAELIREWRHQKRDHNSILYWHEGQMRAVAGQTEAAIALFKLTYKPPEADTDFGWNHYVSGTIAFLTRDRDQLQRSIEQLQTIPEPEDNSFTRPDGTLVRMNWPPNLNVLVGFERCWDRPYREAYGSPCSAPLTQ